MKLVEALQAIRGMSQRGGEKMVAALACGFTPLHMSTFVAAHLSRLITSRPIEIRVGLYGDTLGNVDRLGEQKADAAIVPLEWADIDPRLGLRSLSGWRPSDLADIVATSSERLNRLGDSLAAVAQSIPIALSLPTLPLPPLSYTPVGQMANFELELRACLAQFAVKAGQSRTVKIVSSQYIDRLSPPGNRLDVKSELLSGFPYTIDHASALAEALARLVAPPSPKKGLITDLDDTLWRGIIGEVGVDGVSWNLDQHTHAHGLYQQILTSLAEAGVLVAVASKNDASLIEEAFARNDLIIDAAKLFPREVHWQPKSGSVDRILQAWNIGADAVVFVDDSPMELAEVKAAFPDVECLLFPTHDDRGIYELLGQLRDFFGKSHLSREDAIRLDSLRGAAEAKREISQNPSADPDRLLIDSRPVIRFSFSKEPYDPRALDLVNKTNQFNLNGHRFGDAAWLARLNDPSSFLVRVAYEDKFGPLGTIAILGGRVEDEVANVDFWVMSCRAFSRRIEYQTIVAVFDQLNVNEMIFAYEHTSRNAPLRDTLASITGVEVTTNIRLTRATFEHNAPSLPHEVLPWINQ
jgi:FkbH-like protein